VNDRGTGKLPILAVDLAQHGDHQQQIAEFFLHFKRIIGVDGGQDLIGFLHQIRPQRLGGLLLIPWAAFRRP